LKLAQNKETFFTREGLVTEYVVSAADVMDSVTDMTEEKIQVRQEENLSHGETNELERNRFYYFISFASGPKKVYT